MFDCHHMIGTDLSWLWAEMQLRCFYGEHLTAAIWAALMLAAWGLLVPGGVLRMGSAMYVCVCLCFCFWFIVNCPHKMLLTLLQQPMIL